jgi:hypothetical protein
VLDELDAALDARGLARLADAVGIAHERKVTL